MNTISRKLDTPTFLIALGGGFALVSLLASRVLEVPAMSQGLGMLFLALGGWAIGWTARRFSSRWQQVAAVTSVVVAWYVVFYLLSGMKPEIFGR